MSAVIKKSSKTIIGWQEWCALPELGLPAVKAKIDTGAKTSALHAFHMRPFIRDGMDWIEFDVFPLSKNKRLVRKVAVPLVGKRKITNSGGFPEERYIIRTTITLAGKQIDAEVSLTNRESMRFRLLLGRDSIRGLFLVDASKRLLTNSMKTQIAKSYYL